MLTAPLRAGPLELTPAGSIALASADAARLGPAAYQARYLSLYNLRGAAAKRLAWEVLSAHVNRLSLQPLIVPPVLILEDGTERHWPLVAPEDWEHLALVRLNIDDYGWKRETYGRLSVLDPYFHQHQIESYGGKRQDRTVRAFWVYETPQQHIALDLLEKLTGSQVPVLRADQFFWQTAFQFKQEVGYYGIQEIKDQRDFEKLVGFDRKATNRFSPGFLAAVAGSGVSRAARRIEIQDKIGGDWFSTFDNEQALDRANPLRVLDEKNFTFLAIEVFAHGSNGLWKTLLADNKGKLQDSAPDFIGFNHNARGNDGKIHVGVTCFTCHTKGGIQDIDDWERGLFRPPLQLTSPDYRVKQDLQNAYVRHLEGRIIPARNRYALALFECNGCTPEKDAGQLAEFWFRFADRAADLEQAARECGVTEADLAKLVQKYVFDATKRGVPYDTVVGMWARRSDEQKPQPREAFDEAFPILMSTLRGVSLTP